MLPQNTNISYAPATNQNETCRGDNRIKGMNVWGCINRTGRASCESPGRPPQKVGPALCISHNYVMNRPLLAICRSEFWFDINKGSAGDDPVITRRGDFSRDRLPNWLHWQGLCVSLIPNCCRPLLILYCIVSGINPQPFGKGAAVNYLPVPLWFFFAATQSYLGRMGFGWMMEFLVNRAVGMIIRDVKNSMRCGSKWREALAFKKLNTFCVFLRS